MDGRSRERYLHFAKAHDSSLRRGRGKTVEAHPDGRGGGGRKKGGVSQQISCQPP